MIRTINILNTVPIMVVDQSDERIFKGTTDDILDYENFGNNCSLVLMRFRSNTLNEVIIFNK